MSASPLNANANANANTHQTASSSVHDATVLFTTVNRIGIITLNRPAALNALDHSMIEQIAARLEQCRHDAAIVAVVINSSNEKAFCAGGDVRALLRPDQDTRHDIERTVAAAEESLKAAAMQAAT